MFFVKNRTKKDENFKENKEGENVDKDTTIISYLFDENEDTTYKYVNNDYGVSYKILCLVINQY